MTRYEAHIQSFRRTPLGVAYYTIMVSSLDPQDGSQWAIERRFRQFASLSEALTLLHPGRKIPELPRKSVLAYFATDSFLQDRMRMLDLFMCSVLAEVEPDPQSVAVRSFFNIVRPCGSPITTSSPVNTETELKITEDTVIGILGYLEPKEVMRLSTLSQAWRRSSLSPALWRRVRMNSSCFEVTQHHFLRFLSEPGIAEGIEELELSVQFSRHVSHNLALSLPGDIHFDHLRILSLDSKWVASGPTNSNSATFFGEVMEAAFGDSSPMESLNIRSEITSDMLKTIQGLSRLRGLKHLAITFLGAPVNIREPEFEVIVDIVARAAPTAQTLRMYVEYPENWNCSQMLPDSYFGERIGHYPGHDKLLAMLKNPDAFPRLKRFIFPFISLSQLLHQDNLRFPRGIEDIDMRIVVDGMGLRRDMDRSNRSVATDILSAVSDRCKHVRICTIGGDESGAMNPDLMPFYIRQQPINFDQVTDVWMDDWRQKLIFLERLDIQGVGTGFSEFLSHLVRSNKVDIFVSLLPRIRSLRLVNCIAALDEPAVFTLLRNLPVIEELIILGHSEKLTDSLLCGLTNIRRVHQMVRLLLPKTRYMSDIGLAAMHRLKSLNSHMQLDLVDTTIVTGRTYQS